MLRNNGRWMNAETRTLISLPKNQKPKTFLEDRNATPLFLSSLLVGLVLYKIWPNLYRKLHILYGWIWATPSVMALMAVPRSAPDSGPWSHGLSIQAH
jgi:hypothetical protein